MPQQTTKLAILFADINNSTALYDQLGDKTARDMIARCFAIMTAKVTTHRGTLIKTIGDEIMCTFPSAEAALRSACDMQLAVGAGHPGGDIPIYIHVGFHYDEAICEENDVYGDAVNIAARVAKMTRAREILTTQETVNVLPYELHSKVRQVFRAGLKGKPEEFDIFRVVWELDDTLYARTGLPLDRKQHGNHMELLLQYQGSSYRINDQHKSMALGRGQDCEIIIRNDLASRQHAHVEYRVGKFVLVDHSANGTYIRFQDGHVIRLANEEAILHGSGTISLGKSFSLAPTELVEFSVS